MSVVERGDPDISLDVRCRLVAACGHELGWNLFPVASVRLRDSGQLAIAQVITSETHRRFGATLEHPVAPGDLRAADLVLATPDEVLHIEIERGLVDVQAQFRAAQLKRDALAARDPRPIRLIIALPDSRASRERVAAIDDLLRRTFPIPSRAIWRALRSGTAVGGDGILFVRHARIATSRRARPGSAQL